MAHSIEEKAKLLSKDKRLDAGIRVRYAAIAKGIIKANTIDEKYIVSRYSHSKDLTQDTV